MDTQGIIELERLQITSENSRHGVVYEQTKPAAFAELMSALEIRCEDFVFIDFGAGKGRALLLASDYPFQKIVGVEFALELYDAARENLRRYHNPAQRCRNFELLCQDAVDFLIPHDRAVIYFYNPFKEEVMTKVLANIRRSLKEYPREIFILYCNSVLGELVRESGFAELKASRWYAVYKGVA